MVQSKEQKLAKRKQAYRNETSEQKEKRRKQANESYQRNKEKRSVSAKLKRQEPGEAEKAYEKKRIYYRDNPKKYLLMLAKKRADRDQIEFDISEDDFEIPEYCPILVLKLLPVFSGMEERNEVPTLDRVDNSKGYVKGNVAVISFKANRSKTDMSLHQIENLYNYSVQFS